MEAIAAISAAHRRFGTTGFLPTLISDEFSIVAKAIRRRPRGREAKRRVLRRAGRPYRGAVSSNSEMKGIHDAAKLKRMDEAGLKQLTSLVVGKTLVTLAPEIAGARR